MKKSQPSQKPTSAPAPKPERFLLQRTEIGVLVFNEYIEKAKGQKDRKLTVLEERILVDGTKDKKGFPVGEFSGILPQKSKEAVAGVYESGIQRGRSGIQGGLMNLLGLGGLTPQINEMTQVLNMLDGKVYEHESLLKGQANSKTTQPQI